MILSLLKLFFRIVSIHTVRKLDSKARACRINFAVAVGVAVWVRGCASRSPAGPEFAAMIRCSSTRAHARSPHFLAAEPRDPGDE